MARFDFMVIFTHHRKDVTKGRLQP